MNECVCVCDHVGSLDDLVNDLELPSTPNIQLQGPNSILLSGPVAKHHLPYFQAPIWCRGLWRLVVTCHIYKTEQVKRGSETKPTLDFCHKTEISELMQVSYRIIFFYICPTYVNHESKEWLNMNFTLHYCDACPFFTR